MSWDGKGRARQRKRRPARCTNCKKGKKCMKKRNKFCKMCGVKNVNGRSRHMHYQGFRFCSFDCCNEFIARHEGLKALANAEL